MYLCGSSLGGAIAARVSQQLGSSVDGVIIVAPALNVDKIKRQCKNKILLPLVTCISACHPTLALGDVAPNKKYPVSDMNELNDPLRYHGKLRARVADEMLKAIDEIAAAAPTVTAPILANPNPQPNPNPKPGLTPPLTLGHSAHPRNPFRSGYND